MRTAKTGPGLRLTWLRIWTWDEQEQIQQLARVGLEHGTTGLQVWRADHSATLPPLGVQALGTILSGIIIGGQKLVVIGERV